MSQHSWHWNQQASTSQPPPFNERATPSSSSQQRPSSTSGNMLAANYPSQENHYFPELWDSQNANSSVNPNVGWLGCTRSSLPTGLEGTSMTSATTQAPYLSVPTARSFPASVLSRQRFASDDMWAPSTSTAEAVSLTRASVSSSSSNTSAGSSGPSPSPSHLQRLLRRRTPLDTPAPSRQSCDQCRRRHIRCSRDEGKCKRCVVAGLDCTYEEELLKAGKPSLRERSILQQAGTPYISYRSQQRRPRTVKPEVAAGTVEQHVFAAKGPRRSSAPGARPRPNRGGSASIGAAGSPETTGTPTTSSSMDSPTMRFQDDLATATTQAANVFPGYIPQPTFQLPPAVDTSAYASPSGAVSWRASSSSSSSSLIAMRGSIPPQALGSPPPASWTGSPRGNFRLLGTPATTSTSLPAEINSRSSPTDSTRNLFLAADALISDSMPERAPTTSFAHDMLDFVFPPNDGFHQSLYQDEMMLDGNEEDHIPPVTIPYAPSGAANAACGLDESDQRVSVLGRLSFGRGRGR